MIVGRLETKREEKDYGIRGVFSVTKIKVGGPTYVCKECKEGVIERVIKGEIKDETGVYKNLKAVKK